MGLDRADAAGASQVKCDPVTLEASCQESCKKHTARLEQAYKKKSDEAVRSARGFRLKFEEAREKLSSSEKLEEQLGEQRERRGVVWQGERVRGGGLGWAGVGWW